MGMYTEIFISCEIKKDTPQQALDVLLYLFQRKTDAPQNLPDHPLFVCDRWFCIGSMSSYYFVPKATSNMWQDKHSGDYYITSRSDLKDYSDEIEKFFDWVMPYIDAPEGEFIGYSRYEEDDAPTLYFKKGA